MQRAAPRLQARAELHSRLDESELGREEMGGVLRDSLPVSSLGVTEITFLCTEKCADHTQTTDLILWPCCVCLEGCDPAKQPHGLMKHSELCLFDKTFVSLCLFDSKQVSEGLPTPTGSVIS